VFDQKLSMCFAGVYSSYYWQNTSWDIVIHDALNENSHFYPRFDYYKHLQSLFTKYDYNTLLPYKPKLTINSRIGNDNLSYKWLSFNGRKRSILVFIPAENYQINVCTETVSSKFERNGLISSHRETFGRKSNGLSDVQIISITLKDKGSFDTKINLKSICLH
jgi:hypothetical protein